MVPLLLISFNIEAQDNKAYKKAKMEIEEEFGSFLGMFDAIPEYALPGAWASFKTQSNPDNKIPPKYRELIQLAVAAQIPCHYCVYYHTEVAKAFGATEEEIQEAVVHGAQTRQWSMILQGNQISFEEFKKEFQGAMQHMADKAGKSKK